MSDNFDDVTTEYLNPEKLVGRAVAILVKSKSEQPSKNPKPGAETYTRCVADVIVLDGETTELIPELPYTVRDMFISGAGMTPKLKHLAGTGRWTAGRIDERPSRNNPRLMVQGLQPFGPDDTARALANAAIEAYKPEDTFSSPGAGAQDDPWA